MKKILAVMAGCLFGLTNLSAATDAYLRGAFTNDDWAVHEEYRFSRDGNTYTLHIDNLNGEFKIAGSDWGVLDLGANATFTGGTESTELTWGGANMTANSLQDVTFTLVWNEGDETASLTVVSRKAPVQGLSGTLPVLYINVYTDETHTALNNEIIDMNLDHKKYFTTAEYWLDVNGCQWLEALGAESIGSEDAPLPLQIKARGNWTRIGFSKKPFKLKLDKKQSLLGMSKNKHYAILAHADDQKGYLKNFIGFDLGKRMGLPWTPSQQPVEVVINGDYRGLYFLTESIRVDEDRVNIVELGDEVNDPALISGGYIVELDNYDEDESAQIQFEEKSCVADQFLDMLRVTFDTPEAYSELQRRFIYDQFEAMNDAVGRANISDDIWRYLDLDDAARYYVVEEIVSHTEAYHGSTYLFRDYGEAQKWHFSPLWDFGNAFSGPTDDYFYNHDEYGNTWIPSLRTNATFNAKVADSWLWFMSSCYDGLMNDIDTYVSNITAAAQADYARWNGQPVPSGGSPVADNRDMQSRKNEVVNHLNAKINWLKSRFGDYTNGFFAEPERDTTEAAPLPEYVTTGVEDVAVDAAAPATYYDLQGRRVARPAAGSIYIEHRAGASRVVRL